MAGKTPLDRYRLRQYLATHNSPKLLIGAAHTSLPGWFASERNLLDLLKPATWEVYFPPSSVDVLLAEHVWEHLTPEQGIMAAATCYRFLKPGGYLRVAVPDGLHPSQEYLGWVKPGGTGGGADDHKVLYDYRSFSRVFESAGFRVELLEYFDESGRFHFNEWDAAGGKIYRSKRFARRNQGGTLLRYTSVILDAIK